MDAREERASSANDMRLWYADFCSHDVLSAVQSAVYQRAWEEFPYLCALPDITAIGFANHNKTLVLSTRLVEIQEKEIGEFLMYVTRSPPNFRFENITRTIPTSSFGNCHHPHIRGGGIMCMSNGRSELESRLREGKVLFAVRVILGALFMRDGECEIVGPVCPLSSWPPAKGV